MATLKNDLRTMSASWKGLIMSEVVIPKNFVRDLHAKLGQASSRIIPDQAIAHALDDFLARKYPVQDVIMSVKETEADSRTQFSHAMALLEAGRFGQATVLLGFMDQSRPEVKLAIGLAEFGPSSGDGSLKVVEAIRERPMLIHALANLKGIVMPGGGKSASWKDTAVFPHRENFYHKAIGVMNRVDLRGKAYRSVFASGVPLDPSFQPYLQLSGDQVRGYDHVVSLIDGAERKMLGSYLENKHFIDREAYLQFFNLDRTCILAGQMQGKGMLAGS
jgi:hypothetical protein